MGTYLFGHFNMYIKLVPSDSVGTIVAFYIIRLIIIVVGFFVSLLLITYYMYLFCGKQLSSQSIKHDEIDFKLLGKRVEEAYILRTNVFT
jgi:xyloglucan:xyloglucosyl transferase